MESSVRGFMLRPDPKFVRQHDEAARQLVPEMQALKRGLAGRPEQLERIRRIEELQSQWEALAQARIAQKRQDAQADVGITEGRELKDQIRSEFDEFFRVVRSARAEHIQSANNNTITTAIAFVLFMLGTGAFIAWRGRRDLLGLSGTYESALQEQHRQAEVLQAHTWLREGQSRLSERLAREQEVAGVGHAALESLSQYVGIVVGAVYLPQTGGGFRRAAAWGWSAGGDAVGEWLPADRTLVAECAAQRRQIPLAEVPDGYLQVSSALGQATVRSVLLAPVEHEGRLAGVLEVGWMRPLEARDGELLAAASSILGASIESARYRQRLQEALGKTQQLNEELQVQQEELRTANEELEEQSRALKESQSHLESQQAELEQTNGQLADQTLRLEEQRDALREAQAALEQRAAELQRASRYKSESSPTCRTSCARP